VGPRFVMGLKTNDAKRGDLHVERRCLTPNCYLQFLAPIARQFLTKLSSNLSA
jgi:hypothetical protein